MYLSFAYLSPPLLGALKINFILFILFCILVSYVLPQMPKADVGAARDAVRQNMRYSKEQWTDVPKDITK
jgi:hypothetical protein